jgi:hypothetical protein
LIELKEGTVAIVTVIPVFAVSIAHELISYVSILNESEVILFLGLINPVHAT